MRLTMLIGAALPLLAGCSGPEVREFDARTAGISQLQQPRTPVAYWIEYREDGVPLQREDRTEQGLRLTTVRNAVRTCLGQILARPTDYTDATFASPKESLFLTVRAELEQGFASQKMRVLLLTRTAEQREWSSIEVRLQPESVDPGPLRTAVISAFDSHGLAIALHRWAGNGGRAEPGEEAPPARQPEPPARTSPPPKQPEAARPRPAQGSQPAAPEPLPVRVLQPRPGALVEAAQVRVVIEAPADAEVRVGEVVATREADGTWSADVPLQMGRNTLRVVASTPDGRSGSIEHALERVADPLGGD